MAEDKNDDIPVKVVYTPPNLSMAPSEEVPGFGRLVVGSNRWKEYHQQKKVLEDILNGNAPSRSNQGCLVPLIAILTCIVFAGTALAAFFW